MKQVNLTFYVGDTVYYKTLNTIIKSEITEIQIDNKGIWYVCKNYDMFGESDIGVDVFTTYEEAERKMRKL